MNSGEAHALQDRIAQSIHWAKVSTKPERQLGQSDELEIECRQSFLQLNRNARSRFDVGNGDRQAVAVGELAVSCAALRRG